MTPFNPLDPDLLSDPYPHYAALRETDPVHHSPWLQGWVLTRYDDCAHVLRHHDLFSSDATHATSPLARMRVRQRAELGIDADTVLTTDPPVHKRLRSIVNKAFTPARVARLRPRIEEVSDALLAEAPAGEPLDVIAGLAQPLPIIVIAEMLGIPPEDRDTFKRWSRTVAGLTEPIPAQETLNAMKEQRSELGQYLSRFVEARRARPQDDLITALVQAEEAGSALNLGELLAFCVLLLVAGNETTTNLIGNGALALARHPEQAALLAARPQILPAALEELLRYDSPVQGTVRFALQDGEIGGRRIARGDTIFVIIAAANRDPARFPNPDRLDLQRDGARNLSFGLGIHSCLGAPLARVESEVALGALLRRWPRPTLREERLQYSGTFILRGLQRLRIAAA